MFVLVSGATTTVQALMVQHPNLGVLLTPNDGNVAPAPGVVWAADNSAFSGFDDEKFRRFLKRIEGAKGCLWVAAPGGRRRSNPAPLGHLATDHRGARASGRARGPGRTDGARCAMGRRPRDLYRRHDAIQVVRVCGRDRWRGLRSKHLDAHGPREHSKARTLRCCDRRSFDRWLIILALLADPSTLGASAGPPAETTSRDGQGLTGHRVCGSIVRSRNE